MSIPQKQATFSSTTAEVSYTSIPFSLFNSYS